MKKKKTKTKTRQRKVKIESDKLVSVIILSDNPGYRMKSYGAIPLITINEKPLIDLQIEAIKKTFKLYEIILCVGFDADKISKYIVQKHKKINIRIVENQLFNQSNSCESIRLALNNTLNDNLLIIDGSLLFNYKTTKMIDLDSNSILTQQYASENLQIGVNIDDNNLAQHFSFGAYKTWSEMIFLNNELYINQIKKFVSNSDNRKKFFFESLNDLLKNKLSIKVIENKNPIYKIDNIKTYHHIKENHEIFDL
jgi:NDP-sugar pyrophosphorylase family protein